MKTPNYPENLFRSWTPRGPSRKLEARLFGPRPVESRRTPRAGWIGPLAALGVTCLVALFNQSLTLSSTFSGLGAPASAMMTNPALVASVSLGSGLAKNSYQGTFEWTNLSHSLTTAAPFRPTSGLLR